MEGMRSDACVSLWSVKHSLFVSCPTTLTNLTACLTASHSHSRYAYIKCVWEDTFDESDFSIQSLLHVFVLRRRKAGTTFYGHPARKIVMIGSNVYRMQ
jgi:hypothetical protein